MSIIVVIAHHSSMLSGLPVLCIFCYIVFFSSGKGFIITSVSICKGNPIVYTLMHAVSFRMHIADHLYTASCSLCIPPALILSVSHASYVTAYILGFLWLSSFCAFTMYNSLTQCHTMYPGMFSIKYIISCSGKLTWFSFGVTTCAVYITSDSILFLILTGIV